MKFICGSFVAGLLFGAVSTVDASFLRDVVGMQKKSAKQNAMEQDLYEKAIPLAEYRKNLRARGYDFADNNNNNRRDLNGDDDGQNDDGQNYDGQNDDGQNDDGQNYNATDDGYAYKYAYNDDATDDYSINYYRNFGDYALKYGKCQPVQRFSEDALHNGEASPLVTDDIVILRLCPADFCMSSTTFGCMYNYAEYAISLIDYVRIMLKYRQDRSEQLCDWCDQCYSRRERERNLGNNNVNYRSYGDDAYAYYNGGNGDDDDYNYNNRYSDCSNYKDYCYDDDGYSVCQKYHYTDGSEYSDYLDCVNIRDNDNYQYYVRPRCDGYNQAIHMGVYYDNTCTHYAGNEIDLEYFNLDFKESNFKAIFEEEKKCLPCQKTNEPPYFLANSHLCNKMHFAEDVEVCTTHLSDYYLNYESYSSMGKTSTCNFIQSLRNGNYNEEGGLDDGGTGSLTRQVTVEEKYGLLFSIVVLVWLVGYATYLHHRITNVLVDSLTKSDYLAVKAAHKQGRRRSSSRGDRRRSRSRSRR